MGRSTHYRSRYAFDLSPRQHEVLELISRGRTNAEIAEVLGISLDGVKWHVRELLGKLGVDSREDAAELWRASRRPGARFQRLLPALLGAVSWRVVAAGGAALIAVAGAVVGYAAFRGSSGTNPVEATASPTTPIPSVTPSPGDSTPSAFVQSCDPAKLAIKPSTGSDGQGGIGIFVMLQNAGPDCAARGTLSLTLVSTDGGLLPSVTGNLMQFAVDFDLQGGTRAKPGASGSGIAEWSNWCGATVKPELDAQFKTYATNKISATVPINGLPACSDRGSPSILRLPVGTGPPPGKGGFTLERPISADASPGPPPTATPVAAGQPLPYCDSSQLHLATQVIGGKALMVQVTGFNGDCRVDWPYASFRLMNLAGTALPVDGNGAPIAISGDSKHLPIGVQIQWSNWCGSRTDDILELDTGGARIDTEIAPASCEDKTQPSTVKYVPFAPGIQLPPPSATPLAFAPACDPTKLTPLLSDQGATQHLAIAVQIANSGAAACTFFGDVDLTIEDHGKPIDAPTNPGVVQVSVVAPAGGSAPAAVGYWLLQCEASDGLQAVARLVGTGDPPPADVTIDLPTPCQRTGAPEALASITPGSEDAPDGVSACDPTQLQLRAVMDGAATQAFVAAFITAPHPCWLTGTIRYRAEVQGEAVTGNPADLPVAILLTAGNTNIGAADWANWCGSRDPAVTTVSLLANPPLVAKGPTPAAAVLLTATGEGPPPACDSTSDPSTLKLAPGWEGPSHGELGATGSG